MQRKKQEEEAYKGITYGQLLIFDDIDDLAKLSTVPVNEMEPSLQIELSEAEKKKLNKQKIIIQEIITTEKSYVDGLNVLIKQYIQPMRNFIESNIGNERLLAEWNSMFSSVNVISHVNELLLHDLEKVKQSKKSWCEYVGQLFQEMSPMFKTYTNYINNYNRIVNRVTDILRAYSSLNHFLRHLEDEMSAGNKNTFMQYLITPAQRLTRYNLLLAELLKHTDQYSKEYNLISKALEQTKHVAEYVNSSIHDFENRQIMIHIRERYSGLEAGLKSDLIQPHRKFVLEAKLKWSREYGTKRLKTVRLILFNDMLLICRKGKYKKHYSFTDEPIPWVDRCVQNHVENLCEKCKYMFHFVTTGHVITFLANTEEEKDKIAEKIEAMVENMRLNNPKAKLSPRADPISQRGVISPKTIQKGFLNSMINTDAKILQYHRIRDEHVSRNSRSILGLNLSGLSLEDEKQLNYSKVSDPRKFFTYRPATRSRISLISHGQTAPIPRSTNSPSKEAPSITAYTFVKDLCN
jgi:hypothetical protein